VLETTETITVGSLIQFGAGKHGDKFIYRRDLVASFDTDHFILPFTEGKVTRVEDHWIRIQIFM
jgi:hypothetical protein